MGKGPSQQVTVMTFSKKGPKASHLFLHGREGNFRLSPEHYALSIRADVFKSGEQYSNTAEQETKVKARRIAKTISIVDYCLCYGLKDQLEFLKGTNEFVSELTCTKLAGLRYAIANKKNDALNIVIEALTKRFYKPVISALFIKQRPEQDSLLLVALKAGNTEALLLLLKQFSNDDRRDLFIEDNFFHQLVTYANEETLNQVYELFLSNNSSLSITHENISTLLALDKFTAYVTVASRLHESQKSVLTKIDALKGSWSPDEVFTALSSCHLHKKTTHIGRVFAHLEKVAGKAIKGMKDHEKTTVFKWLAAAGKKADNASLRERLDLKEEAVAKKMRFFSKAKPVESPTTEQRPALVN